MKIPPGLQLLHCLTASATGGESIFADTMRAAQVIEDLSPAHFDDLCRFPVTYHYQKGDHDFLDSKPVFELSPYHDPVSPQFTRSERGGVCIERPSYFDPQNHLASRALAITAVNWSPPFQGPLRIDVGLEDRGRALRNWHEAAQAFGASVNSDAALFRYQMRAGDCVIFNNRRVLHGRTAFRSDLGPSPGGQAAVGKPRWLKGAYLDMDDFWSKYRRLQTRRRLAEE